METKLLLSSCLLLGKTINEMEEFQNQSWILHLNFFLQQTPNLFMLLDKVLLIPECQHCNSKEGTTYDCI